MTYEGCIVCECIPRVACFTIDVLSNPTLKGQLAKNGKQGEGVINMNGEVYQGRWFKNRRHGQGKCCYKNGDVYDGHWADGKRSGHGRLTSKDGSVYFGLWVDGRQHGKGELWVCVPY